MDPLHPSVDQLYPVGRVVFNDVSQAAEERPDRADEAALLLGRLHEELETRHVEALEHIVHSVRRMRRSGRQPRPVPQAAWDAALDLIEALAQGALGRAA